jgi:hypothetical protein
MSEISFLIVGAPKAGTTSLFEYLRVHPQLHMPAEKEVHFFDIDRNHRRGWDWYRSTVTHNAPPGAVCGEATAEYMSGAPYLDEAINEPGDGLATVEETIPRRIERALPDAKLICVLRDPVKRAYSHYRMMTLAHVESRSFDEAVDQLLEPGAQSEARALRTRENGYVVIGEYARVLEGFLRVFPRDQLKVLFSDDLSTRPRETVAEVFEFIGVDADFVPETIDKRFREAAIRERVPGLNLIAWQSAVARSRMARSLWHALPSRPRDSLDRAYNVANYRMEMWNGWRGVADDDISERAQKMLIDHYRSDSEQLGTLIGQDVPWLSSWASRALDDHLSIGQPSTRSA